jgi:peroxiredoxin
MPDTDPTIAERVETLQRELDERIPEQPLAALRAEAAGLAGTDLPPGVAIPGVVMPDGSLLDVDGSPTTLAAARAGSPAVVVFYRGAWCPFCNVALRTYQERLVPALRDRGIALIAVSPQKPDGSLTVREKHDLSFTVLSDPGNQLAEALGILTAPTGEASAAHLAIGVDVPAANSDGTHGLPMPTTVIVDAGGAVRWIDVHPDYMTRSEVDDILAAVTATLG